jgi:hypothetical protein
LTSPLINTRADLETLRGTDQWLPALLAIRGAATIRTDIAAYPQGYGQPGHEGEPVEPEWEDRDDDRVLARLELTRRQLDAEIDTAQA